MKEQNSDTRELKDQVERLRQKVVALESMVAEKERANRMLKDAENLLGMLIKNIPSQVFWKNRDLVYLGCNQAFADVTGMNSPSEVVGKTDFDFHRDPAHAESYREWDQKIMDSGKAVLDIEESYHNADGSEGVVLTSKVPLKDSDGRVFGILGICTDITERKNMELKNERLIKELQEASSEVSTLSGLLPICSNCKGIRDDKGYWNQIEKYIKEHSAADFTHGICPDCIKKIYPDYAKQKKIL